MKSIVICLCIVFLLFACERKNQSLLHENSSDSIAFYIEKGKEKTNPKALKFNTRAVEILTNQPNDSLTRSNLFQVANNYYILGKHLEFKKVNDLSFEKALSSKDTSSIAKAYRYQAEYYKGIQKNDSAFILFSKAEKYYASLGDKINLGKVLYKKGIVQFDIGDFLGADISITQAYNFLKNTDDKQLVYQTLSMIGIVSNSLEDYDKAIEYHIKALQIVREFDLDPSLTYEASTLNNIGGVYQNLNRNEEAITNFKLALNSKDLFNLNAELYARLLDNLGYSYLKLKDYSRPVKLFNRSLQIRDSLDLKSSVIISKLHLSEFYAEIGDTIVSQKKALEALQLARITASPVDVVLSLKQIAVVDHKKSSFYSKEYMRINDSLLQAERRSKGKFQRLQLETDEISSENEKLAEQNRTLLYIFLGTFTIGMLLFVIRIQRAKNRELMLKQAQQKANEDIYNLMISQQNTIEESRTREKKRIAQELHDGVLGRLFGARLNLDSLNRQTTEEAATKRNDYLTELKNIEQDIREISHDLNREKYVLINNFIAILNNLLEEQESSFEPKLNISIDETIKWEQLENTAKINLYRIIQESLQNVNKYANATKIKLEIRKHNENILLIVADNGIGFVVNTKKRGIGLTNMISRVHELNGTFDVRSKKGKGTTISVSFPITTNQNPK